MPCPAHQPNQRVPRLSPAADASLFVLVLEVMEEEYAPVPSAPSPKKDGKKPFGSGGTMAEKKAASKKAAKVD